MTNSLSMSEPDSGIADNRRDNERNFRSLISSFYSAVRAVRLYPLENSVVQKAIFELDMASSRLIDQSDYMELRCSGDALFVNGVRIRLALDNYASISFILGLLKDAGIGGISMSERAGSSAWVVFLAFLLAPPLEYPEEDRSEQIQVRLHEADVSAFVLEQAGDADGLDSELNSRERARQTYVRSLDVTRDVMTAMRIGKSPSLKRVKRAVQSIVDAILTDSSSLMGMTTLRDFDEYTFVHSVNVCILSVALGRKIGLSKSQLLELGVAALLHDIGKTKLEAGVLHKNEGLGDAEKQLLQSHTWLGVLALLELPSGSGRPWRAMTAAYEHHMKIDLSGYPSTVRPRRIGLVSRIIAVADGFDAATTSKVYQNSPWSPSDVLLGMRDNPRLGFDPVMVKAFINLTGIYPIGTLVVLDTFEVGVVCATSQHEDTLSRPFVKIISDAQGNRLPDGQVVDLSERDSSGVYLRTIIRTEDPEKCGIRVSDYFL